MAFTFDIIDSSGRVIDDLWLGHLDRSYVLPNYDSCPMRDCIAWCLDCNQVVPAERLYELEEIEEILHELRLPQKQMWKRMEARHLYGPETEEGLQREVKTWTITREWRRLRQSPARCLRCFSHEVTISNETDHITDPETKQVFRVQVHYHMSMAHQWLYDHEGIPLDSGTEDLVIVAWRARPC